MPMGFCSEKAIFIVLGFDSRVLSIPFSRQACVPCEVLLSSEACAELDQLGRHRWLRGALNPLQGLSREATCLVAGTED